ncbi:hypothetical protein CDD82_2488 [Ophiocordyceps australis]|uniref:Major facilitator superfamily (MFS) profile domain-containing protein n=1 Tax=Ophiocordyceps australis TaxID=1399860 RepID=A0A2C5XVE8_9HYPO|nr:hypothetical protein CDD82_2488 [Ophiocordyceps australis]
MTGKVEKAEAAATMPCTLASPSPATSLGIRRAFDCRVLPIVCCLYLLSYIDRGNIGNAKTAGAQAQLGLDSGQWAWVLNAFYLCYICFQWTTMLWKILAPHRFVSLLCVCWGVAAMSSGAAQNMTQLLVTRCFLAIFEATFGSGAPYFLSMLYQRHELGLRMALLVGMSPLANSFASSLAYGITHIRGSLEPWRLLFIVGAEGSLTVAFAPVVWFLLIDSPAQATFLSVEERVVAAQRMLLQDSTTGNRVQWTQVRAGLLDWKNYLHAVIHFCTNFSFAALSNFLPTIVHDMGHDAIRAQGLTAAAYLAAFVVCVAASLASDRLGRRGFVMAGTASMGVVGYALLATAGNAGIRYAAVWLAAAGVFPALSINLTWILNNQGGDSKKGAGLALLLILGQSSSLISSTVFPASDAPFYVKGCAIGCGLTGLVVILGLALHVALVRENKRRDRLYGAVEPNDQRVDVADEGDNQRLFRYLI